MKPEISKYAPLAIDEDESAPLSRDHNGSDEELALGGKSNSSRHSRLGRRLFLAAVLASLLCSLLNLIFIIIASKTEWSAFHLGLFSGSGATTGSEDLDRPSVYIGLDKLPLNVSRAALPVGLDVFPPLFQPVDHVHRYNIFPDDGHARFTFNGRVAPGDHRVLLTDHITMIGQYRVHDYGMETCAMVSQMVDRSILTAKNQSLDIRGDTSIVEVWNLTTTGPLDVRTLNWDNKPKRDRIVARFSVEDGQTTRSEDWWCGPSGSLQTFELLCRGKACYVEFWQDFYFKPRFGIYISQQPSI